MSFLNKIGPSKLLQMIQNMQAQKQATKAGQAAAGPAVPKDTMVDGAKNVNMLNILDIGSVKTPQVTPQMAQQILQATAQALTTHGNSLPNHETQMPYFDQGSTNGCGTTSLAMVMSYLGIPMTQGDIDHEIRRMNIFSAPDRLLDFARDNGLAAQGYNNGSWDEMTGFIDQGIPIIAMIDAGGEGNVADLHYIAVTGYREDPATGEKFVIMHNPAAGGANPTTEMPLDDFLSKWKDLPGGFNNYFMAIAPKGTALPPGRDDGIVATTAVTEGIAQLTNGIDRIIHPDSFGGVFRGAFEFGGGLVETVAGGIGFGVGWLGDKLNGAVEGIPVVEQLLQPVGSLAKGIGEGVGAVANGFGDAAGHVGEAFEDLFSGDVGGFFGGLGSGVVDVVEGVGKGIVDVAKGVGNAIASFFSGW